MAPWKAPLFVVGIILVVGLAFLAGGPRAALPLGALIATAIFIYAVRQRPFEPMTPPAPTDTAAHIVILIGHPIEDDALGDRVAQVIESCEKEDTRWPDSTEIVALSPARIGFADRWATDVTRAREDAQRRLVITVATLAKRGIDVEARVGDADIVQAAEDFLRSYPATAMVLVTDSPEVDDRAQSTHDELARRVDIPLHWIAPEPRPGQPSDG